jgi:hypothetical protein
MTMSTTLERLTDPPATPEGPPAIPRLVRGITVLCAGASLGALLAQVAGLIPMTLFIIVVATPAAVFVLGVGVIARRIDDRTFVHNLAVAAKAGVVATIAYDVVRFGVHATGLFGFDAFNSIRIFGSWITGQPSTTLPAQLAGWAFHVWNGLAFAFMFVLTFGRPKWWYGLIYGLVMEVIMLGIFPTFLPISDRPGFITISLIGHAAYGTTLGLIAERQGVPWRAPTGPGRPSDTDRPCNCVDPTEPSR